MQKQRWTCSCGQMFTWYQSRCSRCGKSVVNVLHEEDQILRETIRELEKEGDPPAHEQDGAFSQEG